MKKVIFLVVCVLIVFCFTFGAAADTGSAEQPYDFYVYRFGKTPLAIPAAYECVRSVAARDLGLDSLADISDVYASEDRIYMCDSGNNRIIIMNENIEPTGVIDSM